MYINGMTPNIEAFYPPVDYPVSRGTHSLGPLFFWDHSENWPIKCESLKVSELVLFKNIRKPICLFV